MLFLLHQLFSDESDVASPETSRLDPTTQETSYFAVKQCEVANHVSKNAISPGHIGLARDVSITSINLERFHSDDSALGMNAHKVAQFTKLVLFPSAGV